MSLPWDHLTFFNSGPAVSRKKVDALAKRVRLPFPPAYAEFLVAHNGGIPSPQKFPIRGCKRDTHGLIQSFFGVGGDDDLSLNYRTFRRRIPAGLLPIATDLGGNQICLACAGSGKRPGRVFFWEMAFEANTDEGEKVGWRNVYAVADTFEAFLRDLKLDPEQDEWTRECYVDE